MGAVRAVGMQWRSTAPAKSTAKLGSLNWGEALKGTARAVGTKWRSTATSESTAN
ncbi:hypothetical protein [Paenibacillus lignilyticus]|uniref:Uncharacterized protein n=1 Tax=Paenibacillus lignilyticus TaxID=1172615 RepID=A0ABS5CCK1_9BACL|nr:hypothetical protein [Paenibacillus lignilyticus]MBP3961608.1 hypothetical protein [Paenibacillus lignilyticus]MBP3963722.1 hypothetical protein [Paenibacillus lignilyticus]